jgi:hypothetical protein
MMPFPKLIFPALAILCITTIFPGCSSPFCAPRSGNEGIIVRNASELDSFCFISSEKEFLIRSDSVYRAIFSVVNSEHCMHSTLPSIDFSQFSLLGLKASAGGCEIGFVRKAERDDAAKKIIYTVEANGCGTCKKLGISDNLVLIPKVPDDYTTEFKAIEK